MISQFSSRKLQTVIFFRKSSQSNGCSSLEAGIFPISYSTWLPKTSGEEERSLAAFSAELLP